MLIEKLLINWTLTFITTYGYGKLNSLVILKLEVFVYFRFDFVDSAKFYYIFRTCKH